MDNKADFTTGSITKKLTGFMLPILAALILQSMYSAIDLLIVGRFGQADGISGVSTGASILQLFTFSVVSLTTGVTVLMGQYIGNGKAEKIGKLLGNAICFFFILAIILSAVLVLLARPIAIMMQAPEEALEATVLYIRICGAGFTFVFFYNFISCVFRGLGNSRLPLLFVGVACVINIAGDLFFVKVLELNAAGAALATIISQAVSVFVSLIVIRKQKLPFTFKLSYIRPGDETGRFLKIGAPLALQDILTNVTFLAMCAFINKLGLEASSGYGVAQRIVGFVMLIPASIIQSMSAFVAQNVGAGNEPRAKKAMKTGMVIGVTIGIPVALLTFFYGDVVSSIFSDNSAYIARSFEYLKGFAPEAITTCILFSFFGYFNGHSKSTFVMIQGLIQSFLIRLPVSFLMSIRPNASLTGIGLATPLATTIGIVMCIIYYLKMRKETQTKMPR